jgi:hypothetical protein
VTPSAAPAPVDEVGLAYRLCLRAYPDGYRAEHGDEILATICDSREGERRPSLRECAALLRGGLRRRSTDGCGRGVVQAVLSSLRGAAASLLVIECALIFGDSTLGRWWYRGPCVIVVLAVGTLAGGMRRLAGALLLAAALLCVTTNLHGGYVDGYMEVFIYAPALLLIAIPQRRGRRRPTGGARVTRAGLGIAGFGFLLVSELTKGLALFNQYVFFKFDAGGVFRFDLGGRSVLLLLVPLAVMLAVLLAPLDGRIGLATGAAAAIAMAPLFGVDGYYLGLASLYNPLSFVLCGLWGVFWIWHRNRPAVAVAAKTART